MKSVSAKLYFEGAAGSVTGSCNRLEYTIGDEQYQLLVDCGLAQETEEGKVSLPKWNFAPEKISCVLLTHAHVDHCGAIPLLYKNGFNGKVYATDATRELAEIMMQDISRTTQLYEDDDIEKIKWYSVDSIEDNKEMGRYFFILDNVSFVRACFIRSSHVLGASSIYVQWFKNVLDEDELNEQKSKDFRNVNTILFSGDIGRTFDEINPESTFLKPNHFPFKSHENQTEFYVLESTYGGRFHKENTDYKSKLKFLEKILKESFSKDGYIVIPAFALDRTQTVLADLFDVLKNVPLFERKNVEAEIVKIKNDKSLKKKQRDRKIHELEEISKGKKLINIFSVSPLANQINEVYAQNLGVGSKRIASNKKIKFRYLNREPEIPKGYESSKNHNDERYLSDESVEDRVSCLRELKSREDDVNKFSFSCRKSKHKSLDAHIPPNSIIVGASGMCDKGAIKPFVEKALKDKNATIVLTGFTPQGSTGAVLKRFVEGCEKSGFSKDELFNRSVPLTTIRLHEIKAKIVDMSDYYSAHADQNELLTYIFDNPKNLRRKPVKVFLNHGTVKGGIALVEKIDEFNERLSKDVEMPKTVVTSEYCRVFDISDDVALPIQTEEEKCKHKQLIEDAKNVSDEVIVSADEKEANESVDLNKNQVNIPQCSSDDIELKIKKEFLENKKIIIHGVDVTNQIVEKIKSYGIQDGKEKERIKLRLQELCSRSASDKIPNIHSKKIRFLKNKLNEIDFFDVKRIMKVLDEFKSFNTDDSLCSVDDFEKEISSLSDDYSKRLEDTLLCDMPRTKAMPNIMDKRCRAFIKAMVDVLKKDSIYLFVKECLDEILKEH